jgi:hypothetical protein
MKFTIKVWWLWGIVAGLFASAIWAQDVIPITRAHAHNDYEHPRPLLDALDQGFCSIEADVFLVNDQLLVAHTLTKVTPERTLTSLYLNPLRERARQNQGHIYPNGPVVWLFIDLKTEAETTYAALTRTLAPFKEVLTHIEDGKIVTNAVWVVVTGNRPRSTIARQNPRWCSYDGLLSDLEQNTPTALVPIVSEQWTKHFRWRGQGTISDADSTKLRGILDQAHSQGKQVRFWDAPDQLNAWRTFFEAGIDLINTDKLAEASAFVRSQLKPASGPANR